MCVFVYRQDRQEIKTCLHTVIFYAYTLIHSEKQHFKNPKIYMWKSRRTKQN